MSDKSHDTVLATEQQDIYSIEDLLPVILFNCQQLCYQEHLGLSLEELQAMKNSQVNNYY